MKVFGVIVSALATGCMAEDTLSILSKPKNVAITSEVNNIHMCEVADVLSQSLGLPSLSNNKNAFAQVHPLKVPRASVVFTVEGMGSYGQEIYTNIGDESSGATYNIQGADDFDSVASLISMVSGKMPSEHLVPGRIFMDQDGDLKEAFMSADSQSAFGNLNDAINQIFDKSVSVSLSGDSQFSLATAAQKATRNAKQFFYGYDSESNEFSQLSGNSLDGLDISKESILKSFPSFVSEFMPQGLKFDPESQKVTFNNAEYDLHVDVDYKFFAEMVATSETLKRAMGLSSETGTHKQPDFFSFGFTSLENLRKEYGTTSPQYLEALVIYMSYITKMTHVVSEHYQHQAVVTLLSLEHREDMPVAKKSISRREDEDSTIVEKKKKKKKQQTFPLTREDCKKPEFKKSDFCYYGPNYAVYFNILLWTLVALAIFVWMCIWGTVNMDIQDSIVFRMTSTLRMKSD